MNLNENKEQLSIHENLIKLYSSHRLDNEYTELKNFKKQIEVEKSGSHHRPYQSMLQRALTYRMIFLGLGALFFFLMAFMYEQSINWLPYSYIFTNDLAAKNVMLTICFLFSCSSFAMSFAISAEKEALYQFVKRANKKLARIQRKKLVLVNLDLEIKKAHQNYHDALDKVTETKETARLLLKLISKSKNPKKMVKLYNEALLEVNDHLHVIINNFKKK